MDRKKIIDEGMLFHCLMGECKFEMNVCVQLMVYDSDKVSKENEWYISCWEIPAKFPCEIEIYTKWKKNKNKRRIINLQVFTWRTFSM